MIAATRPAKVRPRTVRTPARRQGWSERQDGGSAKERRTPKWAPGWKPDAPRPPSWAAVVSGRGQEDAAATDKGASGAPEAGSPEMDTTGKGEPEREESPGKPKPPRGGAPKGLSVELEDLPKIVAQMQALLPALVTMLGAPNPGAAVEVAAEGAGVGSGFGPAELGGGGKDRYDPYGK